MRIPVTFSLLDSTDKAVEKFAEETHRTKSAVIEMAVDLFFKSIQPTESPSSDSQPITD
jgi:predicted transcriptional regulator